MRKGLDGILLSTEPVKWNLNSSERSRKRSLTGFKLAYVRVAPEVSYTLKEIGNKIKISDAAVVDLLKRQNLVT